MANLRSTNSSTYSTAGIGILIAWSATYVPLATNPLSKEIKAATPFNIQRPWEGKLRGLDKSGGDIVSGIAFDSLTSLVVFANKLIKESSHSPKEFEKTFRKRFRDILA